MTCTQVGANLESELQVGGPALAQRGGSWESVTLG